MLSKEDFDAWKLHPATKEILAILEAKREVLRRQWEAGAFTDYELGTTALVNVGNLGTCKGYAFIAELSHEDYLAEIDDGEQQRVGPPGGSSTD